MERLYSAAEAARKIGTSRRTIVRRCKDGGIGRQLGSGRGCSWVLTAKDIAVLRSVVQDVARKPRKKVGRKNSGNFLLMVLTNFGRLV